MSCLACENAQQLGMAFYVRIGTGNLFISGCIEHVRELFDKLDKADKMEAKNERN